MEDDLDLDLKINQMEDYIEIALSGRLVAQNCSLLKEKTKSLLDEKNINYRFIMKDLQYIDSSGICACIELYKLIKGVGGKLYLTDVSTTVREVFSITNLNRIFTFLDSQWENYHIEIKDPNFLPAYK